jgi:long-chain acyl-CoA synthetase
MNLSELLTTTARRVPDKTALVEAGSGAEATFAELEDRVSGLAAGLQEQGLRPGDRVAVALPNSIDFAVAYLGTLRAGGVVVPLNVMLTPIEMSKVLEDSGASFALTAPTFASALEEARAESAALRVISGEEWAELTAGSGELTPVLTDPDDLAVLAYTSGTTGIPRGAMLTHRNLVANLEQQMAIPLDRVEESDILLLALPLFHIFGLNVALGLLVMTGATGVLVERFEPLEVLRLIERRGITILFGAPTMYLAWVDTPGADQYDLSSVRMAVSGAAALPESVLTGFKNLFGVTIFEGYGMSETAPTLTSNRMAEEPRPASIGMPLPGIDLKLVDEKGEGVELGDPGEILVRGDNVFKGYWGHDSEVDDLFVNGWFRTGDVAVQDEEGYLYLVDRKKDLIIVSGFNVYPSEVEAALIANPKVADAAVVGEPHPYTGETPHAFVVLADGTTATAEELLSAVQERLARFKCPSTIEIVDDLPRLMTGKVLRRALRA